MKSLTTMLQQRILSTTIAFSSRLIYVFMLLCGLQCKHIIAYVYNTCNDHAVGTVWAYRLAMRLALLNPCVSE